MTRTETIVGAWLRGRPRDRVILATKVAGPHRGMTWIRGGPKALDRTNIRAAIEGSLERLGTDYIDLYQLHWPERNVPMFGKYQFDPALETEAVPIRAQLETLAELVREGKIRYVGLSNEQPWGVMEFLRLAGAHDLPRVVSIQNPYNLINRVFETGLAEIVHRERLGLLAYSPLAFGHLSGKYLADAGASGRVTLFKGFAQRYDKPNVQPALAAYADLAHRHGLSPAALALAFVYRRWFVASTIIGATSMAQLSENLAAWKSPCRRRFWPKSRRSTCVTPTRHLSHPVTGWRRPQHGSAPGPENCRLAVISDAHGCASLGRIHPSALHCHRPN